VNVLASQINKTTHNIINRDGNSFLHLTFCFTKCYCCVKADLISRSHRLWFVSSSWKCYWNQSCQSWGPLWVRTVPPLFARIISYSLPLDRSLKHGTSMTPGKKVLHMYSCRRFIYYWLLLLYDRQVSFVLYNLDSFEFDRWPVRGNWDLEPVFEERRSGQFFIRVVAPIFMLLLH
jgi:hypothetical protein